MIVSSKVDLVCWTGRVGLVCREALTTGDAGGAGRISKRAAIEGGTDAVPSKICANYPENLCRTLQWPLRRRHIFGALRLPLWVLAV